MISPWGSLFGESTLGSAADWIEKGVNTYINTNTRPAGDGDGYARNLENEYTDILNLGIIFDVQDKAEAIVEEMKHTVATVLEETVIHRRETYRDDRGIFGDTISNYGAKSLGGDMVTQLGGILANPDASSIGQEDLIVAIRM